MISSEGLLNDKVALILTILIVKSDCEGIRCSALRIRYSRVCRSTATDNIGRIVFRSRNCRLRAMGSLRRYGHIGSTRVVGHFTGDSLLHLILSYRQVSHQSVIRRIRNFDNIRAGKGESLYSLPAAINIARHCKRDLALQIVDLCSCEACEVLSHLQCAIRRVVVCEGNTNKAISRNCKLCRCIAHKGRISYLDLAVPVIVHIRSNSGILTVRILGVYVIAVRILRDGVSSEFFDLIVSAFCETDSALFHSFSERDTEFTDRSFVRCRDVMCKLEDNSCVNYISLRITRVLAGFQTAVVLIDIGACAGADSSSISVVESELGRMAHIDNRRI